MNYDLVYWRHPSIPGIKMEEVSEGEETTAAEPGTRKNRLWLEMARQVYCENGKDAYREIGHFRNGAPFLYGETSRISISHCDGLLVVATLPPTPEVKLDRFSPRAAMGVDAERSDRAQVLHLRERFLSDCELDMIASDDLTANVLAWTIKEAAYKAALHEGVDFRRQIKIERMPRLSPPTPVFDPKEFGLPAGSNSLPSDFFGKAVVKIEATESEEAFDIDLTLFSYRSDSCIVTLAYSPQCAKFGKSAGA